MSAMSAASSTLPCATHDAACSRLVELLFALVHRRHDLQIVGVHHRPESFFFNLLGLVGVNTRSNGGREAHKAHETQERVETEHVGSVENGLLNKFLRYDAREA